MGYAGDTHLSEYMHSMHVLEFQPLIDKFSEEMMPLDVLTPKDDM